ncbi:MAG: hypothetical protein AAB365_02810 [Patescibacteria group bacterium]
MKLPKHNFKSGYTLLFAVLTATLVLGVGVFILSVSKKQYDLSVAARDSMYAIYAADSGIECGAVSSRQGLFATSSYNGTSWDPQPATTICNGVAVTGTFSTFNPTAAQGSLWRVQTPPIAVYQSQPMFVSFADGTCAIVTVFNGFDPNMKATRRIESRGYNSCNESLQEPQASSRTVERALRLTYK